MEDIEVSIYEKLFGVLDALLRLTEEEKEGIRSKTSVLSLPVRSNIVEEGKRINKMYFLVEGAVRCFHYYDEVEKDMWFTFENNFISSFYGFISQKTSIETIQTIEPSNFVVFERKDFFDLVDNNPKLNMMYRRILEATLVEKEHALQRHYYTAAEKYNNLIEESPEVVQRVPLGYIASYLGVNQSTLSRIRKKK